MAEPTLAEIRMFGGNFAPRGWAFCDGQLLAINSNQALFSLLGTTYGGDGRTTFGLPDYRGRMAYSQGTGPGLSDRRLGSKSGTQTNTMTTNTMPNHTHTAGFTGTGPRLPVGTDKDADDPSDAFLADNDNDVYNTAAATGESLGAVDNQLQVTIGHTGGSQAYNNMQPYNVVNFIICIQGLFPSRN